jgi:hypothetical protein
MSFYEPVSSVGQNDWTMGAGRKSRAMDDENSAQLEQMQQQREQESSMKAEADQKIQTAMAEQQSQKSAGAASQSAG